MSDNTRTKLTDERILDVLRREEPPVWSARRLSEETGVVRQTAHNRLRDIAERHEAVKTMKIDRATVYYYADLASDPTASVETRHRESLISEFTDKFVGLQSAPWTAIHPNDGPAEAGDKIQIEIEGEPGEWMELMRHHWDSRRDEYLHDIIESETQAQISGVLVSKPTVPIEHVEYPDDYDLELNIGVDTIDSDRGTATVCAGVKNYLIRPCNDAVFLTDVSVDWISPRGEGAEQQMGEFTAEDIDDSEAWDYAEIEDVGSFEEET